MQALLLQEDNLKKIQIKGTIFLKKRHFIIQERFTKLIYGINTIIKCDN